MSPSPERVRASSTTALFRLTSRSISEAHSGLPKRARRGGPNAAASAARAGETSPSTPEPCTTLNSVTATSGSAVPSSAARAAASRTARAIGCVAPRSRFAAIASAAGDNEGGAETATWLSATRLSDDITRASAATSSPDDVTSAGATRSSTRSTDAHAICPVVIVPVLSSATVPHSASASSVSPPLTKTPRRAHAPTAAMYTSGDMSSAHGAAAERNAKARYIAPDRPRNGMPKTAGPRIIVAAVTPKIALLYLSPKVSSRRLTAGRRFCAASVKRAMRAGVESSALRSVFTTSAPSLFTAPAGTSSPTRFETGSASPVMCWMDTNALPCVTTPSRGTCCPERTKTCAPTETSLAGMTCSVAATGAPVLSTSTSTASPGTVAQSDFKSPRAWPVSRISTNAAVEKSTNRSAPSNAHPSNTVPATAKVVKTWMLTLPTASSYDTSTNSEGPDTKYTSAVANVSAARAFAAMPAKDSASALTCVRPCAMPAMIRKHHATPHAAALPRKKSDRRPRPVAR
mmetsp:Transcript_4564/g.19456  ORF Transcript_4564/g.19456 Transcript_4564/m.19456 type:complete len:518 (+) Transcript_4564:1872-3425(+)